MVEKQMSKSTISVLGALVKARQIRIRSKLEYGDRLRIFMHTMWQERRKK